MVSIMLHTPSHAKYPDRHGLLLSIVLLLLLAGCQSETIATKKEIVRPVRYTQVQWATDQPMRRFVGVSQAGVSTKLSFKVPGTLKNLLVKVGDVVRYKQLIAELDNEDFRLRVQQTDATVKQTEAQARNAESSYQRIKDLYVNNSASRNELDSARAAHESAQASADAAKKQHQIAQQQLSYTELTSPEADCAIANVLSEINENVAMGQPITEITCGSKLEVKVAVPETFITQINQNEHVVVSFDSLPNETFSAQVSEISVSASGTATFPVIARLDDSETRLRPGMAAEVSFPILENDNKHQLIVPAVAVSEDAEDRFVYIIKKTAEDIGIAERRSVKTGRLTNDSIVILQGLRPGELVITAGISRIVNHQKVKLLDSLNTPADMSQRP